MQKCESKHFHTETTNPWVPAWLWKDSDPPTYSFPLLASQLVALLLKAPWSKYKRFIQGNANLMFFNI